MNGAACRSPEASARLDHDLDRPVAPSGRPTVAASDLGRVDVVDRLDPLDRHVADRVGRDDLDRVRPGHQRRRGVEAPAGQPGLRAVDRDGRPRPRRCRRASSQPCAVAAGGGASSTISGAVGVPDAPRTSAAPADLPVGARDLEPLGRPRRRTRAAVTWKAPPAPTSAWTAGAAVRRRAPGCRRPRPRPRSRRRRSRRCASAAARRRRAAPPGRVRSSTAPTGLIDEAPRPLGAVARRVDGGDA